MKDPQQISCIGKLEGQDHGAKMFFIIEKSEENTFEFLQYLVKMETQKIVNLLNSSENKHSKFATKNDTLLKVKQRVVIRITIQSDL